MFPQHQLTDISIAFPVPHFFTFHQLDKITAYFRFPLFRSCLLICHQGRLLMLKVKGCRRQSKRPRDKVTGSKGKRGKEKVTLKTSQQTTNLLPLLVAWLAIIFGWAIRLSQWNRFIVTRVCDVDVYFWIANERLSHVCDVDVYFFTSQWKIITCLWHWCLLL